ncbi:uncharacterized protein LOC141537969 [Cotesia typhae]|uniref:uncharacterized protein LOC141537969 n=1 Tax=Cotesia typhae TaxID=2053667 RepID=UPI003D69BED1
MSDSGLVDTAPARLGSMTAINSGPVGEVGGVRLPLQSLHGYGSVFMYSASTSPGGAAGQGGGSGGEVTLRLREPEDIPEEVLARLEDTATLSISLQGDAVLRLGSATTGNSNLELFDSESGPDLTLSPQTFTSTAEAFINDNSDSLGVPGENDMGSSEESRPGTGDPGKLGVKKPRPKPSSPNRQGPQQCQVCGKVFNNASALTKHKLTHSDERKYVCTMCGKAFKRQDHLNGHMLTHRNKKPFECKAEGCGKSYCDARSLRRHTENHHAGSKVNESVSPSSPTTGPHTPNTPGSNPSTPSTPGAPTTQNGHGHTALKQLLASEPAGQTQLHKNSSSSNDGLTKQQIELIQQIMQQTQQQQPSNSQQPLSSSPASSSVTQTSKSVKPAKVVTAASNSATGVNSAGGNASASSSPKPKVWSQAQQQQTQNQVSHSPQANSPNPNAPGKASPSPASSVSPGTPGKTESKLVECSLCRRQFKNIPALNGHMRLHGGYFKKDGENKKNERKEAPGPPLQTASVNVRALIEEKIIQKRTTATEANGLARNAVFNNVDVSNHMIGKTNFAVPAPPPLVTGEKIRRLSDSEHFRQPNITVGHTTVQKQLQEAQTQAQAQALADMILKSTTKMTVKRATSDPGQRVQLTYQSNLPSNQSQQNQQVSEGFTIANYSEDGGYFSPSLQDEVFQQVTAVPDSVLLQASQLDSIQFQASSLLQDQPTDQLQDITLEDRFTSQHTVNPDLQALVNSPLPDSLAEFSTYGTQYAESPHTLPTQSPLPSPLTRHDSPSFTYPTPPSSQEGLLSGTLPLLSPEDDPEAVRPVSSPLSAAFYTTTLSSAAAVEEALNAVLPEETEADNGQGSGGSDLYSSSPNPNSPLPSPLSATPAPSPLSSLPPSSVSSPGPVTFSSSGFPVSPHALQNQMMPNSEDPLLSSSPKDFGAARRKQFEFQSYKLITNQNLVDFGLGNGSLAGIVVDNNGEYKLIQTSGLQKTNVLVQASPALTFRKEIRLTPKVEPGSVSASTNQFQGNVQAINPAKFLIQATSINHTKLKLQRGSPASGANLPIPIEQIKEELDDDIFLSPGNVSANSPLRQSRKRPRVDSYPQNLYPSRLRRACDRHWDSSYTPPPILNPSRPGSGLYARLHQYEKESEISSDESQSNDCPPPRINIGTRYQAAIPAISCEERGRGGRETDHLLWDPGIINGLTDNELEMYLQFACCASVPGGGRNKEYALHLLHMCKGNIHEAMLKLMRPTPALPVQHPLLSYECRESDRWTSQEMEAFYQGLLEYHKDFSGIARDICTKSAKQCTQFYYLWKKLCPDEYRRVRARHGRPKNPVKSDKHCKDTKDTKELRDAIASVHSMDFSEEKSILHRTLLQTNERESSATLTTSEGELRLFAAYDCPDSFSGSVTVTMAGSTHTGVSGNTGHATVNTNSQTHISSEQQLPVSTPLHYPCKICGKIFNKVKSRSAHMKSHRPMPSPDLTDSKKPASQQTSKQSRAQSNNITNNSPQIMEYQKLQNSDLTNPNANHLWHNPTRLRPP